MIQTDFDAFTSELTRLSEYYEKPVSEGQIALYFESLSVYPVEDVVSAMRQHIRMPEQGRFWPKVADLVAVIDGDSNSQALQAWNQAVGAWESHGVYATVAFEDPVLQQVIADMGGWVAFNDRYKLLKEEPFMRKELCDRYRALLPRADSLNPPLALPGVAEVANRQKGYMVGPSDPVMIESSRPVRRALTGASTVKELTA